LKRAILLAFVLAASPALALAPPHDSSNGISCVNCHTVHGVGGLIPRGADQETMCKTCHNPTGQAAGMSEVGNHVTAGGVVDCGSCHDAHGPSLVEDPHNGLEMPNLSLIRGNVGKYVAGAIQPAVFQSRLPHFAFPETQAPWDGVCQACHTATTHHTNNSAADHAHQMGMNCTVCHSHQAGFAPAGGCTECHAASQEGRRVVTGAAGDFSLAVHHVRGTPSDADCVACHYVGAHGSGTVKLKDPDVVGEVIEYDSANPTGLSSFCSGCHDADGQAIGGGLQPFSDAVVVPNVNGSDATWADSAHAKRPHGGSPSISCYGNGTTTGCHSNGHGSATQRLLSTAATTTIEDFCKTCHVASGHVSERTFTVGGRTYTVTCTTCHNPHVVSGTYADLASGRSPITRPDLVSASTTNPRAMGRRLWGDQAGEKMYDYASSGTYRTPDGDTLSSAQLADYVTFCLDCHGQAMTGSSHGGISWGGDEPHGLNSANSPNGYGTCPNWFACGKAEGWDGDDCIGTEEQCWPVKSRGLGDQIWSREPYNHVERIAGANFILSCGDCHQTHGSGIGSKLRAMVNTGPGTTVWNTMCNNCHYYYSDWHAGMSCGNASCHVTNSIHRMSKKTGSSATRIFDPEIVLDLRFENNLKDSTQLQLDSQWLIDSGTSSTAGSYTTGYSGSAAVLSGKQAIQVGTENAYWSTDEGYHGTWKLTEAKYAMTWEAWVHPTEAVASEYHLATKHTYGGDGGYAFLLRNVGGTLRAALSVNVNGGQYDVDCNGLRGAYSDVPVPLNRWTHVAAVFDTTEADGDGADLSIGRIRIYLNGEDVTTSNAFINGECYAQPQAGEDFIFSYALHSPANQGICYDGQWCASELFLGGLPWGNARYKGKLDSMKMWSVPKDLNSQYDATIGPEILQVLGAPGLDSLEVTFSEGAYTDAAHTAGLTPADFTLVDAGGNNPRTIVSVTHTPGSRTATLRMSKNPVKADFGADTLAAASATAIYDERGKASTTEATVLNRPLCQMGSDPVLFPLNEPAGSTVVSDAQGVMDGTVYGTGTIPGDGSFHGNSTGTNYIVFNAPGCLDATDRLVLSARFKTDVVDSTPSSNTTVTRVFATTSTGGYQMSVWRNKTWSTYQPPDGVASIAFWMKSQATGAWHVTLTDYKTCGVVAGHWYEVTIDWDSAKAGRIPGDIFVDDQGTDGNGAGELWSGTVNCTDLDQDTIQASSRTVAGEKMSSGGIGPVIGANPTTYSNPFKGLVDWVQVAR
jgi:hypothetical protein